MGRLCERPGCSEDAAVAYGMDPVELVFWLDALSGRHGADTRVLCRRHADSMVVPRGWTLDDLREPDLHLFRPPAATPTAHERHRRSTSRSQVVAEQLALGDEPVSGSDTAVEPVTASARPTDGAPPVADVTEADVTEADVTEVTTAPHSVPDPGPESDPDPAAEQAAAPWMPEFDADDDLDGLLSARSPLLARAFRGADRPR